MSRTLWRTLALPACLIVGWPALAQPDFESAQIRVAPVAGNVHMLSGLGGNLAVLIGDDGPVLVDDEFAQLSDKLAAALATLSDLPPRFVINTHWHDDHSGGNQALANRGAVVVAHDNVRTRMSRDQFIASLNRTVEAAPEVALPTVTFTERAGFHLNGEDIEVRHVPRAHTDGDAIVFFKQANVIHAGDILFSNSYPFIDTGSGGSLHGMIEAVKTIAQMGDSETMIIAGHGPLTSKQKLQDYLEMLESARSRITALLDRRYTRAAVIHARPLHDYDEVWGQSYVKPERFVAIVYDDLAAQ